MESIFSQFKFTAPPKDVPVLKETYLGKGKGIVVEYIVRNKCKYLLELGAFFGGSIEFWLNACPSLSKVVAVDRWADGWAGTHCSNARYNDSSVLNMSPEQIEYLNEGDNFYNVILKNIAYYQNKVVPVRMDIYDALDMMVQANFKPDVIYLDADKSFKMLEKLWLTFGKTSLICGDDYRWRKGDTCPMKENLDKLAQRYRLKATYLEDTWIVESLS